VRLVLLSELLVLLSELLVLRLAEFLVPQLPFQHLRCPRLRARRWTSGAT
jgi:hypothetical protein